MPAIVTKHVVVQSLHAIALRDYWRCRRGLKARELVIGPEGPDESRAALIANHDLIAAWQASSAFSQRAGRPQNVCGDEKCCCATFSGSQLAGEGCDSFRCFVEPAGDAWLIMVRTVERGERQWRGWRGEPWRRLGQGRR